jgi:hypothetical protein
MSIKFPSGMSVPSNITIKPSSVKRPEFGTIYGFDADQDTQPEPGIDGVYKLEDDSGFYLTAANDYLAFETAETALWTPTRISTVGWWDASDSSTVTTSGTVVTQWRDKSGNSLHLAPVSGSTGPATNTITQNSLNVLDFDGDCLENNTFSHDISNPIYIAFLVELDSTVVTQYFLWAGTDNNANRSAIRKRSNGLVEVFGRLEDTNTTFVSFGTPTRGAFHILVAKIHGSNAVTYLNGSQTQTGNSGVHNLNTFNLGHAEGESQNFTGKFAEVTAFTDGNDRQKIEGYLAHKWGIDGNLDSLHPYALSAPTI